MIEYAPRPTPLRFDGVQFFVAEPGTIVGIGWDGETLVVEEDTVVFAGPRAYCTAAMWERIKAACK